VKVGGAESAGCCATAVVDLAEIVAIGMVEIVVD